MTLFTGTSVFGVKYKDGVVFAADTLGSYGSLARYPDIERVIKVNDNTVVACSGDIADFQVGRKGKIVSCNRLIGVTEGGDFSICPILRNFLNFSNL